MLSLVISGGQTGADQAGLSAAKFIGLQTGGTAPKGYKTLDGPCYDLRDVYGLEENESSNYAVRTDLNVQNSDGTIRLAYSFKSRGEICTLKSIRRNSKPYFDVDLGDPIDPYVAANWILGNNIITLNVAGNANRGGTTQIYNEVYDYLVKVFNEVQRLKEEIF